MARKNLEWNGKAVSAKMRQAQIEGVNRIMAQCTREAKTTHDWNNRSGTLEGGVNIITYAAANATGVKGVWGAADVKYALIHELGGVIKPVRAKALAIPQDDGSVRLVKSVTIPKRPYLRPAADAKYPGLTLAIRRAYERAA